MFLYNCWTTHVKISFSLHNTLSFQLFMFKDEKLSPTWDKIAIKIISKCTYPSQMGWHVHRNYLDISHMYGFLFISSVDLVYPQIIILLTSWINWKHRNHPYLLLSFLGTINIQFLFMFCRFYLCNFSLLSFYLCCYNQFQGPSLL
jgi:hypothetical protein